MTATTMGDRYDIKSCFQYVKPRGKRKERKNGEKKVVYYVR